MTESIHTGNMTVETHGDGETMTLHINNTSVDLDVNTAMGLRTCLQFGIDKVLKEWSSSNLYIG